MGFNAMQRLSKSLSISIIFQFVFATITFVGLTVYNFDFLYSFYFKQQQTNTGIIINSAIAALLLFGLVSVFYHLLRYRTEEAAMLRFVFNIEAQKADLTENLSPNSIIVKRHNTMKAIDSVSGEINHSALSAMLGADESTKFGPIRFINNILILTGVFGTIVSLSIALLGASSLIDSAAGSLGGMSLVIHGMSTALSTTITAIVSYIIFGYFYTRLNDVQTHFLSGIEYLTTVYLLPQYLRSNHDVVNKMGDLIKSVVLAADNLKLTQNTYHDAAMTLQQTIVANKQQLESLGGEMQDIKQLLREGFRLPEDLSSDKLAIGISSDKPAGSKL